MIVLIDSSVTQQMSAEKKEREKDKFVKLNWVVYDCERERGRNNITCQPPPVIRILPL